MSPRCFARHVHLGLALGLMLTSLAHAGEDLEEVYPATMAWSSSGLTWESSPEDVWRLKSFEFGQGQDLKLAGKKATVVFGRHQTNVLFAVVFPDKPTKLTSRLAGDGEKTSAILLRFNPYDVGRLFPSKTVKGPGEPWLRARAGRIFRRKLGWKWSTPSGNPTIVPRDFVIVDVDTDAGKRRFFGLDRNAGQAELVAKFEDDVVPELEPVDKKTAAAAFDEVWETFDREYATFVLLPELDWKKVGKSYGKQAGRAKTVFDLGAMIAEMLAELEDLHVWVKAGEDWLPGFTRERPLNANFEATKARIGGLEKGGSNLWWGRSEDGIGYLNVHGLGDKRLPEHVDAALDQLGDTWAMVVDLRFNGGGDELLAREVAGRFLDEERVYSKNRYRAGPKHDQLGPALERKFAPRSWRYEAPVVCLTGRKTMSSAESMALMLAQCPQVVTMGATTAGSSGNPRRLELDCGITVNMPRWLDMDPDENPIERVGIAPRVAVESSPEDFSTESDPVFEAALLHLRATPKSERRSGRR